MKISKPVFFVFLLTLISISSVMAEDGPPEPRARTSKTAAGPPPPPDGPIDQNLIILVVGALFLGAHTVYKNSYKRKASM
jgi:hypothetical protein